jgi:hypothetical protein
VARILIIDDEASIRKPLQIILELENARLVADHPGPFAKLIRPVGRFQELYRRLGMAWTRRAERFSRASDYPAFEPCTSSPT